MADSRPEAENIGDKPGISFHNRKQGSFQRLLGLQQKDKEPTWKSADRP